MEAAFRQCVEEERRPQRTGLLSSHLSGGRRSCDRVTIIRDRRAMEAGALSELRHLTARRSRRSSSGSAASLAGVQLVVGVIGVSVRIRCEVDSGQLDAVLRYLTEAGIGSLSCRPPSLEDLFLGYYQTRPAAVSGVVEG